MPTALIVLSLVPVIAGAARLAELTRAVLMGAAWVINLTVAEYVISRRRPGRLVTAPHSAFQ